MKTQVFLAIFILYVKIIYSQEVILNFHQLTLENGLSETSYNDFLYTDNLNTTWISSLDGLNQFDGKEVQVYKPNGKSAYSIQGEDIQSSFFENTKGDIWFTTLDAINYYERNTGRFFSVPIEGENSFKNQTAYAYAFHIDTEDYLWVRAKGKLYRINTLHPEEGGEVLIDTFTGIRAAVELDPSGNVERVFNAFWDDNNGVIGIYEVTDSLARIRRAPLPSFKPLNSSGVPLKIAQIISNIDGETCFISNRGLIFYKPGQTYFREADIFPYPFKVSSQQIPHAAKVGNSLLLVSDSDQISIFNLSSGNRGYSTSFMRAYNLETKTFINGIDRIFLGKDSILWLGVRGEGLYYGHLRNQGMFSIFRKNSLRETAIRQIFEYPNGNVLAISEDGKSWLFDQDGKLVVGGKNRILPNYPPKFKQAQVDQDDIWAISKLGIGRQSRSTGKFKWLDLPNPRANIFDFVVYDNRFLLLGTTDYLTLYDTKSNTFKEFQDRRLKFAVKLFLDTQQRLWIANGSDQVSVWSFAQDSTGSLDALRTYGKMGIVNQIIEDPYREVVYIASSKGLTTIPINLGDKQILNEEHGFINQYIRSVAIDQEHNLWLATNRGIIHYRPEMRDDPFRNLNVRDGLSSNQFSDGAVIHSNSGTLWFGSSKGLDMIPPKLEAKGKAPHVFIKSLNVRTKEGVKKIRIDSEQPVVLLPHENNLTFELAAIEYMDPLRNQIKVSLFRDKITAANLINMETLLLDNNSIRYPNLSHGKYVLQFTGSNAEGIWQAAQQVNFRIRPPVHLRPWFIFLMGLLGATISVLVPTFIYRYRLKAKQLELEKQQRLADRKQLELEKKDALQVERDQINAEFHSILNDGLITIKNTCLQIKRLPKPKTLIAPINTIYQKTFDLFEKKKHLIWAIDTRSSKIEDLIHHIRHYTAKLLDDNQMKSTIQTPNEIENQPITSKVKYNLFMTVKELLHNALKSELCSHIILEIILNDGQIELTVEDNGQGFDFEQQVKDKSKSYGLNKCVEWIHSIEGKIHWMTGPQKGTRVQITISLQHLR